jgi:hypothetical protein
MADVSATVIDLSRLRGAFIEEFAAWDRCVDANDTRAAKHARKSILNAASTALDVSAAALGGIYMFYNAEVGGFLGGLGYIGMTQSGVRPTSRRIIDRFRDDSCLDAQLDHLDPATRRNKVAARLHVALPRSGHRYVDKHLATAALFRTTGSLALIGCDLPAAVIAGAEKLLIGSASRLGCPLTNRQHRQFRGLGTTDSLALAQAVIESLPPLGLSRKDVASWKDAIRPG